MIERVRNHKGDLQALVRAKDAEADPEPANPLPPPAVIYGAAERRIMAKVVFPDSTLIDAGPDPNQRPEARRRVAGGGRRA